MTTPSNSPQEYAIGGLAMLDVIGAFVPCKTVSVREETDSFGLTDRYVTIKLTADRPGYRRGEVLEYSESSIVPRDRVRVKDGFFRIRDGWRWVDG